MCVRMRERAVCVKTSLANKHEPPSSNIHKQTQTHTRMHIQTTHTHHTPYTCTYYTYKRVCDRFEVVFAGACLLSSPRFTLFSV